MSHHSLPEKKCACIRKCEICSNTHFDDLTLIEGKKYSPGFKYKLVKCNCGLIFVNPIPESLLELYPSDYKPHKTTSIQQSTRNRFMHSIRSFFSRPGGESYIYHKISSLFYSLYNMFSYRSLPPARGKGNLLDVGCGTGDYLLIMQKLGWQVTGVEVNPNAVTACRNMGLNIKKGNIRDIDFQEGSFDLVTMWHSLEHFENPGEVLLKVRRLLKEGGKIMIGIPNYNSIDRKIFREYWNGFEIPLHLYHFSPETVKLLLQHAGFGNCKVNSKIRPMDMNSSIKNFLNQRILREELKSRRVNFFLLFFSIPLATMSYLFGQTSIISVHAERTPDRT